MSLRKIVDELSQWQHPLPAMVCLQRADFERLMRMVKAAIAWRDGSVTAEGLAAAVDSDETQE